MITSEDAKALVGIGRKAVQSRFEGRDFIPDRWIKERFREKRGVFTTLILQEDGSLRGCVGIPYPEFPLWEAVVRSSVSAWFKDPRFPVMDRSYLDRVLWELSLLTPPMRVGGVEDIKIGEHGLLVECCGRRGLLLPKVASERGWSAEEFLKAVCLKAGLHPDCWKDKKAKIYTFRAEVYREISPWGEVIKFS